MSELDEGRKQIEIDYAKVDVGTANFQAWVNEEDARSWYFDNVYGGYARDMDFYVRHMSCTQKDVMRIDDFPQWSLRGLIMRVRYYRLYPRLVNRLDVEVDAVLRLDQAYYSFINSCAESRGDGVLIVQAERIFTHNRENIMRVYRHQVNTLGFEI